VTVAPALDFVAKTQLVNKGPEVLHSITIQSLDGFLGPRLEEDLTLCPVRALKTYIDRSDGIRQCQKKLFISFKHGYSSDISKNTVSSWIKQAVFLAYEETSPDTQRLHYVKAHEVRALAASWAYFKNSSIESILQACRWKSHNTFTNFYLRDMSLIRQDMLSLGPVVTALHRS
jgi:hypothetical protein